MKIGYLTSYGTACGVSEYARHLAGAFRRCDGVELTVLGSRNVGARRLIEPESGTVECFDIGCWRPDGRYSLDADLILALDLDVLQVNYQSMLLQQEPLGQLARDFKGVTAVTFHDSCNRSDFPADAFDIRFTHREGVGPANHVIPFGIENHPPLVRTFGLGRTREDVIRLICDAHGWTFESAATSEAALGGQTWMTQGELHAWLREADAIVLWYDDVEMAGSSQAARTAIATRRPVFLSDTTWFREIPCGYGVHKLSNAAALERSMLQSLSPPFVAECSWDRVAELHLSAYGSRITAT